MSHNEDNRSSPWWIVNNDNDDNDAISGRFWLSAPPLKKSIRNRIRRKGRKGKSGLTFCTHTAQIDQFMTQFALSLQPLLQSSDRFTVLSRPTSLAISAVVLWRRPLLTKTSECRSKWRPKWTRPASSLIHYQETASLYPASIPSSFCSSQHLLQFGHFLRLTALVKKVGKAIMNTWASSLSSHSSSGSLKDPIVVGRLKRQA